jgi:hypothetical protein
MFRRTQQQQPQRDRVAMQQQMGGSNEFQSQPQAGGEADNKPAEPGKKPQQMGEGSYEGTRDYNKRTEEYLKRGEVEKDAEAAKPRSEEEAREMQKAEDEGKSHSRGEH